VVVLVPQLRRLRLEQALSQEELAHRARIARTTVMRAEQGSSIRFGSVRKLAAALHVRPITLQQSN
jgi:transcriptional regulator with XRE-family HTH domain